MITWCPIPFVFEVLLARCWPSSAAVDLGSYNALVIITLGAIAVLVGAHRATTVGRERARPVTTPPPSGAAPASSGNRRDALRDADHGR